MSRRKQARPIRHLESEEGLGSSLQNGESSGTGSEDEGGGSGSGDEHICGRCRAEFLDLPDFLSHKKECGRKPVVLAVSEDVQSDSEELLLRSGEEVDEGDQGDEEKQCEESEKEREDVENNNQQLLLPPPLKQEPRQGVDSLSDSREGSVEKSEDAAEGEDKDSALRTSLNNFMNFSTVNNLPQLFPFAPGIPATNVTLEALQNTKVAVAQFAATTMANNANNAAALQELAVLQSTLYTLQHQQMLQLQLIQQLQQQLQITRSKEGSPVSPCSTSGPDRSTPVSVPTTPVLSTSVPASGPPKTTPTSTSPAPTLSVVPSSIAVESQQPPKPPPSPPTISSSLASCIITNTDPPPLNEPNTLEMLQRRAQEVLDSASQGLLANNLADDLSFRKGKSPNVLSPYDQKSGRNEPFFKHRCRYCGKVFGSDSALQIHIRSHTGERPFKCNVCGSRFTTKGNLKVHFQRHTSKFPHIKMNPNPVPEHLDKYHPPLLAQMGPQSLPPGMPAPPHHPHPYPGSFPPALPLYRAPSHDLMQQAKPLHLFGGPREQDMPENLSKPPHSPPQQVCDERIKNEAGDERIKNEPLPPTTEHQQQQLEGRLQQQQQQLDGRISPKQEPPDHDGQREDEREQYPSPGYEDCSLDSKYSTEEMGEMDLESPMEKMDDSQDQPENLSKSTPPPIVTSTPSDTSLLIGQRLPPSLPFPTVSPPSSTSSGSITLHTPAGPINLPPDIDPAKDPAIYTNLLPRPGSNDNSWESLIEVTKTSETSKLQQLVDNIEHKLTDPNQCVICHRVLSCKSALQMHYRTHTGERPFKCKICGRAFTTKGNLKTHMGVHRAKPPMRVLHQCPVCHKKFTNALVLQQHIRLHTGEPTDLTPEQIQAAEIKDYPPSFPLANSMNPFMQQAFPIGVTPPLPGMSPLPPPGSSLHHLSFKHEEEKREMKDERDERKEYMEDVSGISHLPPSMPSFSTSLAALENQVRTITTMASQISAAHSEDHLAKSRSEAVTPTPVNGEKSPSRSPGSPIGRSSAPIGSPSGSEGRASPKSPPACTTNSRLSPVPSESSSLGALDLTPRSTSMFPSGFNLLPPGTSPLVTTGSSPLMTSAISSLTSSVLTSTAFSPIGLPVGPAVRGNTTCNICFKTFACNSALEIHYRSHTKERPFKCTICERGFSTKGNSDPLHAQPNHECNCDHWGQWRIQQGDSGGNFSPQKPKRPRKRNEDSRKKGGSKKYTARLPPLLCNSGYAPDWNPLAGHPFLGNMKQHMLTHKIRDMPSHLFEANKPSDEGNLEEARPPLEMKPDLGMKRSPPEGEGLLPIPKRPPGLPKHLCHVCNKNFSSSSALQIHMRTHTGDKPFKCTICQKAFTTKGNLKVHMGTHMWSNGTSRRGRRMSLDLPPIPMTPKDSEFLQRRPDLFYPYLPAPFLNGMQQKLNEISVIQSANSNPASGMTSPTAKFGALGFGGFEKHMTESPRSQPSSPLSDKPPSSPMVASHQSPSREGSDVEGREGLASAPPPNSGVWDLHYEQRLGSEERKANSEEVMETEVGSPGHATPHSESLVA